MATSTTDYDVIVIGGGPAGLQATLTLARVHRRVLMLDSGRYRNDPATHMHNVVTHDGTEPAVFRRTAREQLATYPTVTIWEDTVVSVTAEGAGFRVLLDDPEDSAVTARGVVLATGLRDTLPDVPGVAELFGDLVAVCPFCHGHEYAGRPVAVLGDPGHLVGLMGPVASSVTGLDPEAVTRLERDGDGVRAVLADGSTATYAGVFVTAEFDQAAPFAGQLGLAMLPSGCVEVDVMGRTSVPGVHAAGDMAHQAALPRPMASVVTAAASGQVAAAALVAHLLG